MDEESLITRALVAGVYVFAIMSLAINLYTLGVL